MDDQCFVIIGPTFFLTEPSFQCTTSKGDIIQCDEDKGCQQGGILWPHQRETMSSQLGLYCKDKDFRGYVSATTFFGSIFGNFIMAYFAEIKGRKLALFYSWGIATIGYIMIIFSFNKYVLMLSNFITGFGIVPSNTLNLVIINEQYNDYYRQKATTVILFSWGIFQIILSLCAYFIQDWRNVYIYVMVIPAILAMAGMIYVEESPSFVIQKNFENSAKVSNKIAKQNNKKVNLRLSQFDNLKPTENEIKKYNYFDLFKLKSLRFITIAAASSMFISQFIYYVTQFSLDSIGDNTYINGIIIAFGEILANIGIGLFIEKIPRKTGLIIFMATCNVLCLCSFFLDKKNSSDFQKNFQTINSALIRIFTTFNNAISAVFVEELYPTPLRSLGLGFQMGVGILGSTFASLAGQFFKNLGISQMGGVGVLAIPFNFINWLYRETKGQKLQQEVEEHKRIQENDIALDNSYKLSKNI